jgi:hypothetical protein
MRSRSLKARNYNISLFRGISVEELRATIDLAWLGCAHGGRSGPHRRYRNADVRLNVAVAIQMSAAGG